MARGIEFAPATEGKTPAKASRMSIKSMSGRRKRRIAGEWFQPKAVSHHSPLRQLTAL